MCVLGPRQRMTHQKLLAVRTPLAVLGRELSEQLGFVRIPPRIPMGRFGELDELVGAAVFLASPAARYVTGVTLAVDGGFLAAGM